ncbi:DUF3667 domain-containing protein [Congregibacter sp.]|uniref:DUF3667 domain-containing protein n=1 Tax=Congregibacter sp. TaxID=2744308 RepID=UPI003859A47C
MIHCKNCGLDFDGNFCPQCGQKDLELRRPIVALIGEVLQETFDVDGRAARTLWTMLRHPGVLTRDYLDGKRRLYSSPFRLYLIVSVLFFVLAAWVAGQGALLNEGQTDSADALGQARLFSDYVPKLMFFLLPVFALILKLVFRKRFFFDHLIHSLHLHSVAYLVLAFMLPLEKLAAESVLAMAIQLLLLIYMLTSFVTSVVRVYRVGWVLASAKSLGIVLLYMALVAGVFESVTEVMMPGSPSQPFLTD